MSAFIGILSLNSCFPRIPDDADNPESYHLPARVRVIDGADSRDIVRNGKPAPDHIDLRFPDLGSG